MTRNPSRFVTHWLAAVMLITLIAAKPESSTRPNAQQRKPGSTLWHPSARRLVVHEWGTFTAIAGRDGKPVE